MFTSAILVAAGKGSRLKARTSKPLLKIGHKPLLICSLEKFEKHPSINEIIIAVNRANRKAITGLVSKYRITKVARIVLGGRRRQDSVKNCLKALNKKSDLVLVHDGGRPFIKDSLITALIVEAKKNGASVAAVPVKETIKEVTATFIKKTLNRNKLWAAQTPQAFKKNLMLRAYKKFSYIDATDDSALVERLGIKPKIVMGSYGNIKITTPEDLILAEALVKEGKFDGA